MPSYAFETVDVFTETRFGGNPLAVFPDAHGLSDGDMQRLAAEFNLSETTFVLPPERPDDTARVRIFNRSHEMPFAGHPMVGTAYVVARRASGRHESLRFEVPAGVVAIRVTYHGDAVHGAVIDAPQPLALGLQIPADDIAGCIGLAARDVLESNHRPTLASVGNTYVIAEVTAQALDQAVPDLAAFRRVRDAYPGLNGRFSLYLYAHAGQSAVAARMFAPLVGTFEDPATGSAATPLAGLLLSLSGGDRASYQIQQGTKMARPSRLLATAHRAADGIRASVGGSCVPVLTGSALV